MLDIGLNMVPPTPEERADILRRHISKGGVFFDYDRLLEYYSHFKIEQQFLGETLAKLTGETTNTYSKSDFKKWCKRLSIFKGFNLTPTGDLSFDADSLNSFISCDAYGSVDIVPGMSVTDVVRVFKDFCFNINQSLLLFNIIKMNPPTGLETEDGRRICIIRPVVEIQNTGRVGYKGPAIQNLPKYMHDLYVAPKGWILLAADSSQIEPKLTFSFYIPDPQITQLIKVEGDAYYAQLHYATMDQKLVDTKCMTFDKTEITPELKEARAKLKTYGNGVMYGSTSNIEKDPMKEAYINRIGKHPARVEMVNKLQRQLDSGKHVFETLFGTKIDIFNSESYAKAPSENEKRRALLNCAINNPIQGTAGDLMGFSLNATDELMRKHAPNSWIVAFKHDEGVYCVQKDEYKVISEELKGHTSYNIDNRIQIYNDPIEGRTMSAIAPCSYSHLECGYAND